MVSKFSNVNHSSFFLFPRNIKFPRILSLITWVMKKHPWAFLNNKKYYKNYRLLQHFEMSKILLDTLRTKNNYKYAIHFWNTLSLNVLLCAIPFLFEGGKALINPAQWIIHCSITKVTYTITLYIGKCLCFFFLQQDKQHYLEFSNSYFGKEKLLEPSSALHLKIVLLFSSLTEGSVCL